MIEETCVLTEIDGVTRLDPLGTNRHELGVMFLDVVEGIYIN
jgi:hypothetical protein